MTAISTEMPSTAPNCRKQDEIADPVAKRAGGSSITAAEQNDANDSPTPVPVSNVAGRNSVTYAGEEPSPTANSTQPDREQQAARHRRHALPVAIDHPPRQRRRQRRHQRPRRHRHTRLQHE